MAFEKVASLLVSELNWPTQSFIPDDPMAILLFYPSFGFEPLEVIAELEKLGAVFPDTITIHSKLTIGDIVQQITAKMKTN